MKKLWTFAVTSALAIGVTGTALAAPNPFSDVPMDHWSYDAVAELAQEGIIEGYGDGTFHGDRAITRYEMAQMIARAMAKDVSGDAKATLDKLAAEYADELNNLGVRVDELEKKIDNVKFDGYLRMRYQEKRVEGKDKAKKYPARLRTNMRAQVNEDWQVRARVDSQFNLDDGKGDSIKLKHAYAQGPLFGATAKLGKIGVYSADSGMIWDTEGTGAQLIWNGPKLNATATAVTVPDSTMADYYDYDSETNKFNYQALELTYDVNDRLNLLAAYHHAGTSGKEMEDRGYDDNNIWEVGFDYKLGGDLKLNTAYARSDVSEAMADGKSHRDSYKAELQYKGANAKEKGSFGTYLAYRKLSDKVSFVPTYDAMSDHNLKGWEIGGTYTLAENVTASLFYFDGEQIGQQNNKDWKNFVGEIKFLF